MKKTLPRIHNLETLRIEKLRLQAIELQQRQVLLQDIDFVKKKFSGLNILNQAAIKVVPEPVRHSGFLNDAINFIATRIFKRDDDVVNQHTDKGRNENLRNILLVLAEGVGTYLLTRYLKKKFL